MRMHSLQRWIRAHEDELPDPLGLVAAVDTLRRKPGCEECLRELRSMLWAALPQPAPGVGQRVTGDRAGAAYLDTLRGTHAP